MLYIIIAFCIFYAIGHNAKIQRLLRKQVIMQLEQERQEKEVKRLTKEQEKQAAQLVKHEERIAKLEFRVEQAERDIEHWNEQLSVIYTMLDYEKAQQEACVVGGKEWTKHQNKIISLENRVHASETRLAKAKYTKAETERKLA